MTPPTEPTAVGYVGLVLILASPMVAGTLLHRWRRRWAARRAERRDERRTLRADAMAAHDVEVAPALVDGVEPVVLAAEAVLREASSQWGRAES